MKLKLTYSEFMALYQLCKLYATKVKADEMYLMLLQAHMTRIYKKLYVKAVEVKTKYSVKLTEEEALAFWLAFEGHDFEPQSFEGNFINGLMNTIHQQLITH